MNERLLQFIWQFQYFNRQSLHTTEGEILVIEKPGFWNHHQGPDFSEAMIRLGATRWVGNIELHLRSSDWERHHHRQDARYGNIILHVVWEDDQPLHSEAGELVATLELQHRIPRLLLERYEQMMETLVTVPCHAFLPALDRLGWTAWKERLAAERLERRSGHILGLLQQSGQHWDEVFWWLLAANFGIRVNAALFEGVAKTLPVGLLGKHRHQIHQLEALLLGQANLLGGTYEEAYPVMLQREYQYLKKKYKLQAVQQQPAFLRMRPAAFPTVRLAQLAMLLYKTAGLFSIVKEATDLRKLLDQFAVTANDYWHYHYRFDEETPAKPKQLGKQMAENILINTVIPVLFAYGLHTSNESFKERAIHWLYQLPPEHNQLTRGWQRAEVEHSSALDSQALIELTNHYCTNKRCLECAVGNRILRNGV
ncbi:MAG: DUF2851 family protein [Chitinophagaceae bacterium]|nr:DUF2851 family protein [Chitinophagaceae bacterium]